MAGETEKELQQKKKRFRELAEKSYMQNIYCFTGFLGMAQLDAFYQMEREISHVSYRLFGGHEGCERQMIRFGSPEMLGYEEAFPIVCIHIKPLAERFAEDLGHRDILGACMNLGIERGTMGDIICRSGEKGKDGYLYCTEAIAPYVAENLTRIRHTDVSCSLCQEGVSLPGPELTTREYQTASERVDGVIAKVYRLSREKSLLLFREKRVFVDGRLRENGSSLLKADEVVSVRGFGKFIYRGMTHQTRKGKYNIRVEIYV